VNVRVVACEMVSLKKIEEKMSKRHLKMENTENRVLKLTKGVIICGCFFDFFLIHREVRFMDFIIHTRVQVTFTTSTTRLTLLASTPKLT